LAKLSKGRISKERHMTKQLVTDIRFWCVVRPGVVPDVLGGVEHTEGQASQEVPGG